MTRPILFVSIRPKLILAFVVMAAMTAICGGVGLLFVDRIGTSVAVFSDVTSPLLTESMALLDNARRMRSIAFRAVTVGENVGQVPQQLDQIHVRNRERLQALNQLAKQAGIDVKLPVIERDEQEFIQTLKEMIAAYWRDHAASSIAKQRRVDFDSKYQEVRAVLLATLSRAEGEMVKAETYPMLRDANRLVQYADQIDAAVKLVLVQSEPAEVTATEQRASDAFKAINTISKRLTGTSPGDDVVEKIQRGFADLQTLVLGSGGLFARQRQVLAARSEILAGRNTVDAIDRTYLGMLNDVRQAVVRVNQDARSSAAGGIAQARAVVAGSILLAILAGLSFAFLFGRRITAPLLRLTDHAASIRDTGELRPLTDPAVIDRRDEFGLLSRSLNSMIAELADARKRLIDWSETEIRTQYERLNAAIDNMPQGLCMFDVDQKLIICNQRYAEIYHLDPAHQQPGTPLREVLQDHVAKGACPEDAQDYIDQRLAAVAKHKPFYFVNEMRDGHIIAISHQPLSNGGSVATHEDITERRQVEAKMAYMAHHDALTGLPNRTSFRGKMEEALHHVDRGETLAVLCLDLDHFKAVNDTLGHPVGDALLQAVSDRIRACVRPTDTVARLGGDEFAIVQISAEQPVGATSLAERLIEDLRRPFEVQGHQVVIGTSVGIAIGPNDGSDPDRLLKSADMALYRAKTDGRSTFCFFEADMDAQMQARRTLELDLRTAVALSEFEVFYQPVMNLMTRQVASFEALLRWRHPRRGLVSPSDFIPLAEEIGLITPIGAWVLKQACREAMKWPSHITVAVNLSPVQFKAGTVVLDVVAALGASGLPASRLELEITETVLLQDTDATVTTLNQLRDLGVHISMDDFGTGYSSLGYLRKFPFDRIKIDRSFVRDLSEKSDSVAIVRAVAELGRTLGMSTTAEGVETEEQFQRLREEGCTEVQGYLFSEARPAHELSALLKELSVAAKAVA